MKLSKDDIYEEEIAINLLELVNILKKKTYDITGIDFDTLCALAALGRLETSEEEIYIVDGETLKNLVSEINEKLVFAKEKAEKRLAHNLVEMEKQLAAEMEKKAENMSELEKLKQREMERRIAELEETVYRLKLEKTIILPTADFYKTKMEYDALREKLGCSMREINKLRSDIIVKNNKIVIAEKELKDLKMLLRENGILYAEEVECD